MVTDGSSHPRVGIFSEAGPRQGKGNGEGGLSAVDKVETQKTRGMLSGSLVNGGVVR